MRQALGLSRSQCSRYIIQLVSAEYVTSQYSGNLRKVCYRVDYRDDYQKLTAEIRRGMIEQIEAIEAGEGKGKTGKVSEK